eukprot:m.139508 g.139508  ORF g.139508 m.139508 type:complete len:183 (-) comp17060_c0_seq2:148-696(-)
MTLALGKLVKVLGAPLVPRCGALLGKAGQCHVLVALCGHAVPHAASGFDVLVGGADAKTVQQTLAVVCFLLLSDWSRYFSINLLKQALCSVSLCPRALMVDKTSVVGPLACLALRCQEQALGDADWYGIQLKLDRPCHLRPMYDSWVRWRRRHLLCRVGHGAAPRCLPKYPRRRVPPCLARR